MRDLTASGRGTVKSLVKARHLMMAAALAGIGAKAASATTYTWTGPSGTTSVPTSGNWNAAADWVGGIPVSGTGTELDFLGTSTYISTDNITGAFNLNILKINGSGGTIAAASTNSIAFNGSTPTIQQIGAGTFTIAAPVSLTAATAISQVNSGEIDFTGAVAGSGGLTLSNVSGSPTSSVVKFTGADTFNGLTVNANVTARAGLSTSTTTLGSGTVTLHGGILQLQGQQTGSGAASQQIISVTGYNQNPIVSATTTQANVPTATSTSIDSNQVLYQKGFVGGTSPYGLNTTGLYTSAANSSVQFQLGYNSSTISGNTVLQISSDGGYHTGDSNSGAFTLNSASQKPYQTIDVLSNGTGVTANTVQVTFNFAGGTSETQTLNNQDWYYNGSQTGLAVGGGSNDTNRLGSVRRDSTNYNDNYPIGMYENDFTLSTADQAKTLTSITFSDATGNFSSDQSSFDIYAVSGTGFNGAPTTNLSQTYANPVSVTSNSSIDISGSLKAVMSTLSIGSSSLSVTSSDTTATAYSLTMGATTLSGNATFNVAASSGGGAGTLTLGALNDGGMARTITLNPTGTGSITLATNAASLGVGTVINLQNGTLNSNSGTAIGSSATVNLSSPATFVVGASQQVSALNGTAGAVTLSGNTLTIGSTDNLSSNFGGVISGGGYLIANSTGTVTLSGASTFGGSSVYSNGVNIQTSVQLNNNANVVAAGSSSITNGTVVSGPLGTAAVLVNSGASLLLSNTPGLTLANPLYGTSSGTSASTFGALNTTGVTTFSGNITLGTGVVGDGDISHNAIVAATGGGEVDFTGNILANNASYASSVTVNRLAGSGTGVVRFTGSNTYTGGTTVNPNATLAIGPSGYSTGLGTGTVTLAGGTLALQGRLPSPAQATVPLTGFNADTILDKNATSGTASSTGTPTSTIDGGSLYFESGYMGNTSTGVATGGAITSATTGHAFQLATDSSGLLTVNNTLQFTTANSPASLALASATSFKTLDFLVTGQSSNTLGVTITFSAASGGGTDTLPAISTKDWYGGSSGNNAVTGLDPLQQATGNILDYGGAMTLQEYDLTLPTADQGKSIASIAFDVTTLNGATEDVLAVSGLTNPTVAGGSQSYANNLNVTQNSGIDVSGSLNASMGTLTIGSQTLKITSADTTTSPYTLTTGAVALVSTTPTFDVENSAGGGPGTLILGSLNDNGAAQHLTKTGPGTLVLSAPATMIGSPSVYNVAGGTLASNDSMAMTYNTGSGYNYVAVNVGSTAAFSIGADQTITSLGDYDASPTVNGAKVLLNGHTLTIGSVMDASSTFSGVISDGTGSAGTGGIVKAGGGTLRFNGASTYTGPTYVGFGTLLVANTTGSATGTGDVTLANTSNATLASSTVGSISGNLIAGQSSNVQPGGNGSIGTLAIGGLVTGYHTDLNFDLGSGTGTVTNGDLLNVTGSNFNIGADTLITFGTNPTTAANYRLIGVGAVSPSSINLASFDLPTATGATYSLSTTADPGYIDLVVATGATTLIWDNHLSSTGNGTTWDNNDNGAGQNWNAGGTASSFTTGDAVIFNDSNNGNYTVNITANVLPASVTVTSANTYTIGSTTGNAIGDNPSAPTTLTQSGGGTLNITNVNTFTGATNVSGSGTTLHLASTGSLATTSLTVGTGSKLNLDGLLTGTPTVADSGTITLGASDNTLYTNNPLGGFLTRTWSGLTIGTGASLVFKPATTTATRTVLVLSSLTNNGVIDVANNDMIIHNGSAGSVTTSGSIANQIASGFDKGQWNGTVGILSSNASNSTLHALGYAPGGATFDGIATTATDILVKYTYYGDANLDGKVDASDYSKIDSAYAIGGKSGWSNGDFNYDGIINGSDYTLIDNAFNTQGAQISAELASPLAEPTAEIAGGGSASAVPEPTSLSLLAIGAAGLLGRRRRQAH